jgi:hypothetical protein
MNLVSRFAAAALAVAMLFAPFSPAWAGDAEKAYLNKFVGTWTGGGTMSGSSSGKITCKLVFKANGAKVNYTGRCTVPDVPAQSISGSVSYNDAKKQYEVRSRGKTTVAKRIGNTLSFTVASRTPKGKATTTMSFSPTTITVEAVASDSKGQVSNTRMTLKKS